MNLTQKQRKILNALIENIEMGKEPTDIDQLIDLLPYETTKASFQFSVRALIAKGLIERGEREMRRGKRRRLILPTDKTFEIIRCPASPDGTLSFDALCSEDAL